jgi:hypothetical protein
MQGGVGGTSSAWTKHKHVYSCLSVALYVSVHYDAALNFCFSDLQFLAGPPCRWPPLVCRSADCLPSLALDRSSTGNVVLMYKEVLCRYTFARGCA